MLKTIAILLLSAAVAGAQLIAPTNMPANGWIPGVNVGVPGGIPTNRTILIDVSQAPYNADKTGVADATAIINSAIVAVHTNEVVYLPTGTYKIGGNLQVTRSGISVRGDGTNLTRINCNGSGQVSFGVSGDWQWNFPPSSNTITAGLTAGSSNLTIADTSGFIVGHVAQISFANNASLPVVSVSGFDLSPFNKPLQIQLTHIVSKTPTVLTVWPPLYTDYGSLTARVYDSQTMCQSNGLENIYIDYSGSSSPYGVYWQQCYSCWVSNVVVHNAVNRGMTVYYSLNCQWEHCQFDGPTNNTPNHAGLLYEQSSGGLVENNIMLNIFPGIQVDAGSSGNVFGYNFALVPTALKDGIIINHGPHNAFNLYEGNITDTLKSDGYFGGESQDTIYRNWITGEYTGGGGKLSFGYAASFNRFSRYVQAVGNVIGETGMTIGTNQGMVLGNPNISNSGSSGTAPPWTDGCTNGGATTLSISGTTATITGGAFLFAPNLIYGTDNSNSATYAWQLVYPSTANGSYFTNYLLAFTDAHHMTVGTADTNSGVSFQIVTGPGGYQEYDSGVASTINRKGNYNFHDNAIPAGESIGTNILADSLYLSGKPSWFGNITFPPIQPTNSSFTTAMTYSNTPAGFRFLTGLDPTPPAAVTNYGVVFTHP